MTSLKYSSKLLAEKPVYSIKSFTISKESSSFESDLSMQGYPFYAGAFKLNNTFKIANMVNGKIYFISSPSFEAIVLKVKVNAKEFSPLIYSPWETEITGALKEGENKIEITLINSLRNLLGPHHHSGGELNAEGPASFTGTAEWPDEGGENNWYDLRLTGKPTLWSDDYSIIPFGLLEPPVISVTD
jgi:hypothetical protein